MFTRYLVASLLLVVGCAAGEARRAPEVRYEPTPMDVAQAMLALAEVRAEDLVADLGCGDGRIVIEAARRHEARHIVTYTSNQLTNWMQPITKTPVEKSF